MNLTEKIREKIITEILDGQYLPGDKLPTERNMAILTATSRITVRRAYEQLEKKGIIVRRPKHGTCVANSFRGNTGELENIAVISTLKDNFSTEFIEAMEKVCFEQDILTVISVADEKMPLGQADKALGLASLGVKNLILWGFDNRVNFKIFERLRILGVNMVFFDRVIPGTFADYVGLDNKHGISSIFNEAINSGCRKFVFTDITDLHVDSNDERRDAVMKLCKQNNYSLSMIEVQWKKRHELAFRERCREIFPEDKEKVALICVNDNIALSLCDHVPPNVSIFSFDGTDKAVMKGIITYQQPIRKMAEASVIALKSQQRRGEEWSARQYRFKGKIIKK